MDMKEKLVELFRYVADNIMDFKTENFMESLASYLIANGVTVQEWIGAKDRLPENDYGKHWEERKYYIVRLRGDRIRIARYGYKEYEWWVDSHDCVLSKDHYTEVTHWMEAPQPPKGE